jgi:hypothetical protein
MASIRKQIQIHANPDDVWEAVRDFGAPTSSPTATRAPGWSGLSTCFPTGFATSSMRSWTRARWR